MKPSRAETQLIDLNQSYKTKCLKTAVLQEEARVVKIQPIKITLERSVNKFVVFLNDCNACPVAAFFLFFF